ncbi:translation initiation factor eif-2b subunit family protein [Colletotrichum karsti]|uniref:Translation initiation factor eif-2b subunit family protein n=1 Tax=Colletotrichum karsti TaxID=1095194 RepID=A0A9P6LPL7_9PEZI|nr:translation initiation factor eif-2b subunit family protein [Colletotrichum karsti]KAF9880546.1 translation initiation factor eif-2b subunit family protein [Colletotrichum karsti]
MTRRTVVSSFIFKFPSDGGPQVALFRRSDRVRTYQNRLAPVSGSVDKDDPSPLHAAWREIKEETGLTPAALTLFRQGKDYRFSDESIGREWIIHPFAFRLKSPEDEGRIQIDWEHTGFQWFDPREVRDVDEFGGVPKLAESLRRVWFEIELGERSGKVLSEGLLALQRDHESGARQLAGKALDVLVDVISEGDESLEIWWRNTRLAAWHLWKNGRESMGAAILNVLTRSLSIIDDEVKKIDRVSQEFQETVARKLQQYALSRVESVDGIWKSFEGFLRENHDSGDPIRILTLSSSSTILECLHRAVLVFDSEFDIRILESRPLFEGVSMASRLVSRLRESGAEKGKKVNVSIFTDASAAIASDGIKLVLIGADLIRKDGSTSNKTGSLPAVLSARYCAPNAKVLVLAENEKILPYEPPGHEENDIDEVVVSWRREASLQEAATTVLRYSQVELPEEEGLKASVKNVYFEWVPTDLIDGYMFEDGPKYAEDITELAGHIGREADAFFEDI